MKPQANDLKEKLAVCEKLDAAEQGAQEALASACITSSDCQVRTLAVEKITEPSQLANVAKHALDFEVLKKAVERIDDREILREIAEYPCSDRYACILALRKIEDEETLFEIAQKHAFSEVRAAALSHITDADSLLEIAESNTDADIRESAVSRLEDPEKLTLIASTDVNKSVRRAAIAALSDPYLLATIATGVGPMLIRKQALQRIREVTKHKHIDHATAEQLVGCLDRRELAASAIELMEASGFDWVSQCSTATPSALYESLADSEEPAESAVLRKALAQLYKNRVDLRAHLLVHLPRSFLEASVQSPAWWSLTQSKPGLHLLECR